MNAPKQPGLQIAYKWVSCCLVAAFLYYWLLSYGLIFFRPFIHRVAPGQVETYDAFWWQNWRLFSSTSTYKRELNLVLKDRQQPSRTDTIDLVRYSIAQKRQRAPFNNYHDALERLLYTVMNSLENRLRKERNAVGNMTDSVFLQQSSALLKNDSIFRASLQNLENYARYVIRELHKDAAGKEFQLVLAYRFIPPPGTPANAVVQDKKIIFVSNFKPF